MLQLGDRVIILTDHPDGIPDVNVYNTFGIITGIDTVKEETEYIVDHSPLEWFNNSVWWYNDRQLTKA